VLDGSSLKVKYSWTETPPLYRHYSISETKVALINKHAIYTARFGTGKWGMLYREPGICVDSALMISDSELVNVCKEFSLISTEGHVLSLEPLDEHDSADKIEVSKDGRVAALSLSNIETKRHVFSEASQRLVSTRVEVFNLSLRKRILTVDVTPLPRSDYDFALSPDGSSLAVLNDRTVSVYLIPVT
jgi:hypothetical protein